MQSEVSSVPRGSKNMLLRFIGDSKLSLNLNIQCAHLVMDVNNPILPLAAVLNARSNIFFSLKTARRVQAAVRDQHLKL